MPHPETARTVTWTFRRRGESSIATAPSKASFFFFFEQSELQTWSSPNHPPTACTILSARPPPDSTMADHGVSRFTPQNKSTHERLSTHTVGLVALSDFRKRRAEVLEQQEREAREAAISGTASTSASASTSSPAPDRSSTGTPDNAGSQPGARPLTKPRRKRTKTTTGKKLLLSFGGDDDDDDEGDDDEQEAQSGGTDGGDPPAGKPRSGDADTADAGKPRPRPRPRFRANASVGIVPRAVTKAALLKEATEREALRREFVAVQEAVKATEVALPFVFYDGTNIPGGTVRFKKGDFVWVFLDRSRKVGAELGVGDKRNTRRGWARVGVDDLMLVRDTVIIPHVCFPCFPCSYSMHDIRTPLLTLQRHPSALRYNSTMISTSSS